MSGDRSSTEPEPEGSNPGPEARAEELPRQPGGISAWFNSGPKPPADDAAQGRLEDVDSWNGASGDTALDDERSDSSGVPVVAAARGGATADRTGEGRRVVQVRILDGEEPDQVSSSSDRDDAQPEQGVTPDQKQHFSHGRSWWRPVCRELRAEERSRSANSLTPDLAEGTGYTVGTVRKYLGDIKRAERQAIAGD